MRRRDKYKQDLLITTDIGKFYVDPRDQFVTKELVDTGNYSPQERAIYAKFFSQSSKLLWLGAHIGAHVVPISKMVQSITAFEANPFTHTLLEKNLALNNCLNVKHFNVAASDADQDIEFACNVVNSGGSKRMPIFNDQIYFDDETKIVTVKAKPLDNLLNDHDYEFIFMDIEGSETLAMRGMPKIISKARVLVAEFIPHHLSRVAGVTVSDFLEPLRTFKTAIFPSFKKTVYGTDIEMVLGRMFEADAVELGIIFVKDEVAIDWA